MLRRRWRRSARERSPETYYSTPATYLWVNAYKRQADYYSPEDSARLERVDPLFPLNNRRHPSLGESCRGGASVFSVDGEGTMRRCHFIRAVIGNIYEAGFESALHERPCKNETCGCHMGYVHLDRLDLYGTFGEGVLERIPVRSGFLSAREVIARKLA